MPEILFPQDRRARGRRHDARRHVQHPWRRLYGLQRWRGKYGLRKQQLAKQRFCERCLALPDPVMTLAVDVNHKHRHNGDPILFFDPDNLESLCTHHHRSEVQQEEAIGYSARVGIDGYPIDPKHPANAVAGSSQGDPRALASKTTPRGAV